MKYVKSLSLVAISLSLAACGGIKSKGEIAELSPTDVAVLACNAYKNIELEQLKPLFPEKSYESLISKNNKYPNKLKAYVKGANCEVKSSDSVIHKKQDATRITFKKFSAIKVFKIDGEYQIAVEG